MATYKQIFGQKIKALSADPPAAIGEGQIWYNDSSDTFKSSLMTAAWASAPVAPTPKRSGGSAGTQTANLIFAGQTPGGTTNVTAEYNGSAWTTSGNYGSSSYAVAGFGTQTSAIGQGGHPPSGTPTAFEYNGASWTATPATNTASMSSGGAGTAAAGLKFGGASAGAFNSVLTASEEWNGSAWVASPGNLNTARGYLSGFGTQTAALGAGGYTSPPTIQHTNAETYDGSTWTATSAMPRGRMMGAASGTQTAAFYYGGNTDLPTITSNSGQTFDGSAWTTSPATLATGRRNCGGSPAGTSTVALASCGTDAAPADVNNTEEFTVAVAVKTITTS